MKEQLARDQVTDEQEVKGRCNAILQITSVTYEDLVEGAKDDNKY